jgi:hypothetical protein
MMQVARNLTDDGFLRGVHYLILDRDPLYTASFCGLLRDSGVTPVRLPARSPNLNAYAERFVASVRSECLARIVPLGEGHLRAAVRAFVDHYHEERPHQGLGNQFIAPKATSAEAPSDAGIGSVACSSSTIARPRSPSAELSHTTGVWAVDTPAALSRPTDGRLGSRAPTPIVHWPRLVQRKCARASRVPRASYAASWCLPTVTAARSSTGESREALSACDAALRVDGLGEHQRSRSDRASVGELVKSDLLQRLRF